jgi:predicted MFS family arabinose efflux permease
MWCLATLGIGLLTIPLIHDPVRAAIVVGVVASLAIAGWPLVTVLVTEIVDPRDGADGMAMALVNGAWAAGAALGSAGSTAVASAMGPSAWYVPLAIGCGIGAAGLAAAR